MQIKEMDELCAKIIESQAVIAEYEDKIEEEKAKIEEIKKRVEQYFIETNREDPYRSPKGTLYLASEMQVIMPKGQALRDLFEHFKKLHGEDVAWMKMSIHNQTLKSEIKQHNEALEARGDDPLLEPLPGVETPKTIKKLRFLRARK